MSDASVSLPDVPAPEAPERPTTEAVRRRVGSNQAIGFAMWGVPVLAGTVALFVGKATWAEYASFATTFCPLMAGIILGISGALKWKNGN